MLFKLSLKNIKKSFKDYAIYFLTLILGVAIFYVFNSMDSQQAMLDISSSTREIIKLMLSLLAGVSVFVSFILGFLIVYANNFLIKRRKKEFGVYMTLGMGKGKISKILFIETLIIGIISLIVGLIIGIFASQLMSVVVAKMFEADMTGYKFVFSQAAMVKTIIYFGIMYLLVMIFNTVTISNYNLIDLLTASKKNEKVKLKNKKLSVLMFLVSIGILALAYYKVTSDANILSGKQLLMAIALGVVGTFLFFWSLSGFLLKLIQSNKKIYLKDLNAFVLRQIDSKINTTVFSMTVICLMLFFTISILSSALSLNKSLRDNLTEVTPADISITKSMDLNEGTKENIENSKISIEEDLKKSSLDFNESFSDFSEITEYQAPNITLKTTLGETVNEVLSQFQMLQVDSYEGIVKISDYNKIAKILKEKELTLKDNEYIVLCDYDNMKVFRDKALEKETKININGKEYSPKYKECVKGFLDISSGHTNIGVILVPDEAVEGLLRKTNHFTAIYKGNNDEEKQKIENKILALNLDDNNLNARSKISLYEASVGLGAVVTFIGIYLGVIFLISSAAILALKELSESSDNIQRYEILRKIGTDEKIINKALFKQIGIFFIMPLMLAIVHSIFGIKFANIILEGISQTEGLLPSIIMTAIFILIIYGGYFIATYFQSKSIIKKD
ncbi:MAG: ABC transporter permease [Clostridium sp.]|jgi:putative ABC transport system permease protein|nr:ABC transporter permease [Clostridium sp.]